MSYRRTRAFSQQRETFSLVAPTLLNDELCALSPSIRRSGSDERRDKPAAALSPEGGERRHGRPTRVIGELLGTSDQMREVRDPIDRVADTDVTVLIRGESGTGKELVARAIHAARRAATRTFVKVNCAALPSELLESELFGFERGAFTGAVQHKPGNSNSRTRDDVSRRDQRDAAAAAVQAAAGPAGRRVRAAGRPARMFTSTCAIVAATNRDLERAVADGPVSRGPVLPPERGLHHAAAAAPAPRRNPRADRTLPASSTRSTTTSPRIRWPTDTMRLFGGVRLAGQRARAREPDQAGRRSGSDDSIRRELADNIAGRNARVGPHPRRCSREPRAWTCRASPPAGSGGAAPEWRCLPALGIAQRHRAPCRARSRARADLSHAAADALEPPRSGGDPGVSYKALLYKIKEAELDKAS